MRHPNPASARTPAKYPRRATSNWRHRADPRTPDRDSGSRGLPTGGVHESPRGGGNSFVQLQMTKSWGNIFRKLTFKLNAIFFIPELFKRILREHASTCRNIYTLPSFKGKETFPSINDRCHW